jgi:hypothetical protein
MVVGFEKRKRCEHKYTSSNTSMVMGVKTRRLERSKPRAESRKPSWYRSREAADFQGWMYANAATQTAAQTETRLK